MMRVIGVSVLGGVLGVVLGCGSVSSDADAPPGGSDGPGGGGDGPAGRCNPSAGFGTPTLVGGINTSFDETGLSLTRDELTAFVGRSNQPGIPQTLRMATRPSATVDFSAATEAPALAELNSRPGDEYGATTSGDGLLLYFHRQTTNEIGILVASRPDTDQIFSSESFVSVDGPALLSALTPHLSADGQTLYWLDFSVFRLHSATRGATPSIFTNGRDVTQMDNVFNPVLSADELTLYYSDGFGNEVLAATRPSRTAMFPAGVPVANVNSAAMDWPVYLTVDGCILYLASSRPGGLGGPDIWEARRGM